MKIEVAKRDLEAALQVVSISASSTGSDLTTHFVFRTKDDLVEVLSNNGRLGASAPFIAKAEGEGAFTVESWRLNKWIAAVEDAALVLEAKDGSVTATSPKGSVKFQSLDPSSFPYWDDSFDGAEEGVKLSAKRLGSALSHAKLFISDKDTTSPKLAVTEMLENNLQSTDKGALALVTLRKKSGEDEDGKATYEPEMVGSNLRIHGKDLAQVLSFLSTCGDEAVQLREGDRALFLEREDGSVFNVGRPRHAFPELDMDESPDDPHWWQLKTSDLKGSIGALAAAAAREDRRMTFNFADGMVSMEMTATSGSKNILHLEPLSHGSLEGATPMPEDGFEISYPYLLSLLSQYKDDTITFGLHPQVDDAGKHRGGWTRFREERGDDYFVTLLVWLI
jgi:DNA polymerase III sliding clamp (beta) subunit (PCNA family)